MFKYAQFITLRYVLQDQISKILHCALLHLGPLAPGWNVVGFYLQSSMKYLSVHILHFYLCVACSNKLDCPLCIFYLWLRPMGEWTYKLIYLFRYTCLSVIIFALWIFFCMGIWAKFCTLNFCTWSHRLLGKLSQEFIYLFKIFALLDAGGMFKNAKFCTLHFSTLALGDLNFNLYISLVLNV